MMEMMKQLQQEKGLEEYKILSSKFYGREEDPGSWKIVNLVILRKPDAGPKKEIRSYRAIAVSSVMWRWCATL